EPKGVIEEEIYPEIGEQTLKKLVNESKSLSMPYQKQVYLKIRDSYANHYRQIIPKIIDAGVNIIGGCCGTTPDHVKVISEIVKENNSSRK
ncbi:MAG: homocysteine S-methyltransferase family protein, partial [Ignavibacteriota bacterium]